MIADDGTKLAVLCAQAAAGSSVKSRQNTLMREGFGLSVGCTAARLYALARLIVNGR
jgi:hypothetical protein